MRGTAFLKDWEAKALADREQVIVTARCLHCHWNQTGTVQATREAHAAHRTTEHPEIKPPARRKRLRPYGQLSGFKSLDDNIAQARQQGAAGWAAPE